MSQIAPKSFRSATAATVRMAVESLEARQMLAADPTLGTATLVNGTLTYTGTAGYDDIYVTTATGGRLRILNRSKEVFVFDPKAVKKMVFNLGAGNDNLYIGSIFAGPCAIDGGAGDDHLYCSTGNDTINGGDGIDYITALAGNDSITGGAGADSISGNDGNDTLYGNDGNDRLWGGKGNDVLDGGLGADIMQGEDGTDTVSYADRTKSVFVDATGYNPLENPDDGEAGEKDFVDCDNEILIGGKGNDVLTGTYDPNKTKGTTFSANNKLVGGDGNDTLNGLDGNDTLDGGLGNDVFNGGAGVDTADYSSRKENLSIRIDDKPNDGSVAVPATKTTPAKPAETDNVKTDVENVWGGSGNDLLEGSKFNNALTGNGGNDSLYGLAGDDSLTGGAGQDQLFGGDGNDSLFSRDLINPLPTDPTARQKAIDVATDKLDGGAGTDGAQFDLADTSRVGVEKTLA